MKQSEATQTAADAFDLEVEELDEPIFQPGEIDPSGIADNPAVDTETEHEVVAEKIAV